ncbi:MAG: peptidase [Alphaproteobacteria bacterium]|jgi:hypothetical protein|nr:peptidase [Alphaproteobacteria bacterium]
MDRYFKNPLLLLSVLCWLVICGLWLSVFLNTRTIDSIGNQQTRQQNEIDRLRDELHALKNGADGIDRVLAREISKSQQRQAQNMEEARRTATALRNEIKSLRRAVEENRLAAEKSAAGIKATIARATPVTFAAARSVPASGGMHIDGNGGRDLMNGWDGLLYLDGSRLTSVEIFNLADGRRNEVRVMAPGLNNLEDDFMELRLDPAFDSVLLDRCLIWKKDDAPISDELQKKFDTAAGAYIWTATDADGKTRRVAITSGTEVNIDDSCNNDYSAQVAARDAREKQGTKPQRPSEERSQPYTPDFTKAARIYNEWVSGTKNPQIKDALTLIAAAVEARKLPPDFMNGKVLVHRRDETLAEQTLRLLPLDPKLPQLKDVTKEYTCDGKSEEELAEESPGSSGIKVGCTGIGSIKISESGFQVFIMGKRAERIDPSRDPSLVIIAKNTGDKTIYKTCPDPGTPRVQRLYHVGPAASSFGGIGLSLTSDSDGRTIAQHALPGYPAEKAGIMAGERLVSIDGQPLPATVAETVARIRGDAGTPLTLGIETKDGVRRDVPLLREEIIDMNSIPWRTRIDYQWPYEFDDFILFGPGIRQGDLVKDANGKWLNTRTGDWLNISPCFNFVFSE